MGISGTALKFFLYCKREFSVNFSVTATLGRQGLYGSINNSNSKSIDELLKHMDTGTPRSIFKEPYCEQLLSHLGADLVESFDYSAYEGCTFIHDMNTPLPETHKNKYTLVYDGGASEHMFNVPVVYKNIMDMTVVGGHVITSVPANNFCGHGFYQFSPEFFFNLFSEKNGFEVKLLSYAHEVPPYQSKLWIIQNPVLLKRRVKINTFKPTLLYACARKIAEVPELTIPQQSDYENVSWVLQENGSAQMKRNDALIWLASKLPGNIREWIVSTLKKEKTELKL